MATLTIRNLSDPVEQKLRLRAAERGRTIEDEVCDIITRSVNTDSSALPEKTGMARADERKTTVMDCNTVAADVSEDSSVCQEEASFQEQMRRRLERVRGIWKGRGSTDELMRELRGED